MKYLNFDQEIKLLSTTEALQEYLSFRKKNDVWIKPFCNECACVGLSATADNKLSDYEIQDHVIAEAMADNKLLLIYPENFKVQIMPIRYTAFPDLCNRAGLKGRTIELMEDKGKISALDPIIKAQWLSTGLSLNGNECNILIRDEKISSIKSHEYQIFPEYILINTLKNELQKTWPNYTYERGMVSHEYLSVSYFLNADDMEASFQLKLEDYGIKNIESLKAGINFSTSDVGNSSVSIAPFYKLQNVKMLLGKPIHVRHDTCNSIETVIKELSQIAASFREAEEIIEKLGNTPINYAKECFLNIVDEFKLPKLVAKDIAAGLNNSGCMAIDIYIALNDLVEKHYAQSQNMSLTSLINLSESVSKLMYIDFTLYD